MIKCENCCQTIFGFVSTQYFYVQKFENLIQFTIAKKKCGIMINMVGGGFTTLIKDEFVK